MSSNEALRKNISTLLRELRVDHGFRSTASFAKALNLNENTLRTYIDGKSFPSIENLEKIAVFMRISIDDLNRRLTATEASDFDTVLSNLRLTLSKCSNEEKKKVLRLVSTLI